MFSLPSWKEPDVILTGWPDHQGYKPGEHWADRESYKPIRTNPGRDLKSNLSRPLRLKSLRCASEWHEEMRHVVRAWPRGHCPWFPALQIPRAWENDQSIMHPLHDTDFAAKKATKIPIPLFAFPDFSPGITTGSNYNPNKIPNHGIPPNPAS